MIDAISTLDAVLAELPIDNIDTDQIIPARFLTTTERAGLGRYCFNDWRYNGDGSARSGFALDAAVAAGAQILLAGHNFGCGSSREHAPWALLDYGIRVVIASQIADIFRNNALKNGLLPIVLTDAELDMLRGWVGHPIRVSLEDQQIALPDGHRIAFEIDAFARECLLRGVDQLGYLLAQGSAIDAFERNRAA